MGGSSGPSKTTQTTEPPAFIKPFLQFGAQEAKNSYLQGGPQQFPGSTVVPFSSQTQQALDLTQQRALEGSPVTDAAQGYVQRTLNGAPSSSFGAAQNPFGMQPAQFGVAANPFGSAPREFDGQTNPYLDATFNRAADQVQNRLQSSFAGAGRNIGAARAPAALELNDLAERVYGGAYESDRNRSLTELQQLRGIGAQGFESERDRQLSELQQRLGIGATGFENAQNRALDDLQQQRAMQLSAAGLAPTLAGQDYADLAALEGVGARYEDLQGQYLQDQINRFNFQQNAPQMNLDRYLQRITGAFPGQETTLSEPTSRNRTAGALGGAAAGAKLGSAAGPYGALFGGIAGGLYGAFG